MNYAMKGVSVLCGVGFVFLWFAPCLAGQEEQPVIKLRFEDPMASMVNARRWDETARQWMTDKEKNDPLFFDAVHRFLLLRFPGCAEAIHAKLAEGYEIESAELAMTWTDQEFMRCEGYSWRSWPFDGEPMPKSHARIFLLRRPWVDDARIGPTWNAYINGAGYWRGGGGLDAFHDRYAEPLGEALLCKESPVGAVDVTAALTGPGYGATAERRLRQLADCGFVIQKAELMHREFGQHGGLGPARIWIKDPKLLVTLKRTGKPGQVAALPPATDVAALAETLSVAGGDGEPTTVIPENLSELIARRQERWKKMPAWMRRRVSELRTIPHAAHDMFRYYTKFDNPELADRQKYLAAIQEILAIPPGYFMGHSHVDPVLCYIDCQDLFPDVVRYHLRKYMESRWTPPYDMEIFHHRVGYFGDMSTLNLQTQGRAEAILVGELMGLSDLTMMARRALSLLNRQMIYSEGTIQERGDSFYQGITLGTLQAVAKCSEDPLTRLKASLGIEKMVFELNCTYHPGLRRQVSTIARRYRMSYLMMAQDVPRAVLHTLSKKGVLIHRAEETVHGLPTTYFNPCPPDRVALLAPWGREWEANAIDEKPLPFPCTSTFFWRSLIENPIYFVNYMGRHYALASMHSTLPREWHNQAVWRRAESDIQTLDELAIMFIWDYMNGKPMNPQKHEESEGQGPKGNPVFSMLQHKNKMIYCMRPTERTFSEPFCRKDGGVKEIFSRVFIYTYGRKNQQKVFINGESVKGYPVTARHGDRIAIHDGVTYVGLIPWVAADLPRKAEVKISYTYPRLLLDSYLLETDAPLPDVEKTWQSLMDAPAGWIVELGDVTEYGSFDAFQEHIASATLRTKFEQDRHTLHMAYASGQDTLEMGFKTDLEREGIHYPVEPPTVVAYHRVNGRSPYPARGIDLDSPLGQMGRAPRLEKGGAVLETVEGQMAMLRIEPMSNTYEAVNPFIDPTPFRLSTPEGVTVQAEGPIGCARITVQPAAGTLEVDYYLPPAEGALGVERLQADAEAGKHGGPPEWEARLTKFFRPGVDVSRARRDSARALIAMGFTKPPKVVLNGKPLPGPFQNLSAGGRTAYRIPIVVE